MRNFLKSLCFWRYRALFIALLAEHAELAQAELAQRHRAIHALSELRRIHAILAPYGELVLTGQTRDDDFEMGLPIRLPALEYEMAKAWFHSTARMSVDYEYDLLMAGFNAYSWRGRHIQRIEA